jgi:ABC-type Na+ efflux pump permease subunit
MGLISIPLVAIAAFLLLVTVIGIPIALVLPIAYVLMVWCGQIAATYVLGAKILRRRLGEGGLLAPIVAGTLFIALFFLAAVLASQPDGFARTIALFLWVLGGFLVFALSSIGSGAMLLSRFGSEPREPNQAASAVASAPPLPAST